MLCLLHRHSNQRHAAPFTFSCRFRTVCPAHSHRNKNMKPLTAFMGRQRPLASRIRAGMMKHPNTSPTTKVTGEPTTFPFSTKHQEFATIPRIKQPSISAAVSPGPATRVLYLQANQQSIRYRTTVHFKPANRYMLLAHDCLDWPLPAMAATKLPTQTEVPCAVLKLHKTPSRSSEDRVMLLLEPGTSRI